MTDCGQTNDLRARSPDECATSRPGGDGQTIGYHQPDHLPGRRPLIAGCNLSE
jgi:hypothetical protein